MENKITLDPKKLDVVALNSVRPNDYNPKDRDTKEFAQIKRSIELNGLRGFIVVRQKSGATPNDLYEIIDGEQRWRACKELGYEKVIIYNEGQMDDKQAKELTIWWQVQVPFNELTLSKLLSNMIEEFGSINTPFTEKKLLEMQELAKFSMDSYKDTTTMPPVMPTGEMLKTFMIQCTASQYELIYEAIAKVKRIAENEITDTRAVELICAEYLATPDRIS